MYLFFLRNNRQHGIEKTHTDIRTFTHTHTDTNTQQTPWNAHTASTPLDHLVVDIIWCVCLSVYRRGRTRITHVLSSSRHFSDWLTYGRKKSNLCALLSPPHRPNPSFSPNDGKRGEKREKKEKERGTKKSYRPLLHTRHTLSVYPPFFSLHPICNQPNPRGMLPPSTSSCRGNQSPTESWETKKKEI